MKMQTDGYGNRVYCSKVQFFHTLGGKINSGVRINLFNC